MTMTCVIHKCTFNKKKTDKRKPTGVSTHSFPRDPDLKKLWMEFVSIQNNKEYKHKPHHRICSQHFASDSFIDGALKFRSVPTEFFVRYDTSDEGWCDKPDLVFGPEVIARVNKRNFLNLRDAQCNLFNEEESEVDDLDHGDTLPVKNLVNSDIVQARLKIKTLAANSMTNMVQQLKKDDKHPCIETIDDYSIGSVCDEDNTVTVSCIDHNDFPQDPLWIENSSTNPVTSKFQQLNKDDKLHSIKILDESSSESFCDQNNILTVSCTDNSDFPQDPLFIENSTTSSMMDEAPSRAVPVPDTVPSENLVTSPTKCEVYSPEEVASRLRETGRKRFINDFTESDFDTPRKRARNLQRIKNIVEELQQKLINSRKMASRWKKKAADLQELMEELKEKDLLREKTHQALQVTKLNCAVRLEAIKKCRSHVKSF